MSMWKTREGRVMRMSDMTEGHLANAIAMAERRLADLVKYTEWMGYWSESSEQGTFWREALESLRCEHARRAEHGGHAMSCRGAHRGGVGGVNIYRDVAVQPGSEEKLLVANLTENELAFWERIYLEWTLHGGTKACDAADWAVHRRRKRAAK